MAAGTRNDPKTSLNHIRIHVIYYRAAVGSVPPKLVNKLNKLGLVLPPTKQHQTLILEGGPRRRHSFIYDINDRQL
jgi:hypothetical protein